MSFSHRRHVGSGRRWRNAVREKLAVASAFYPAKKALVRSALHRAPDVELITHIAMYEIE